MTEEESMKILDASFEEILNTDLSLTAIAQIFYEFCILLRILEEENKRLNNPNFTEVIRLLKSWPIIAACDAAIQRSPSLEMFTSKLEGTLVGQLLALLEDSVGRPENPN